jgi:hypothetical protein
LPQKEVACQDLEEEFEDIKGAIRIRISKNRQHNDQHKKYKRTNNDLHSIHIKLKDRVTRTPIKTGGDLRCSGRVSSSCSTSGTRRVNLATSPVISRQSGKKREVFTRGTYSWLFVTQIFHSGQPSHGGDRKIFEVMISTLPKGTLVSEASLLAATLYQGNPERNHKLWNIISSERYILHMQVMLECCYI